MNALSTISTKNNHYPNNLTHNINVLKYLNLTNDIRYAFQLLEKGLIVSA